MHHRILHRTFGQAVKLRLIPYNPCDAVDPPRPEKKQPPVVPVAKVLALLEAARDTPYHTPAMLALTCGLCVGHGETEWQGLPPVKPLPMLDFLVGRQEAHKGTRWRAKEFPLPATQNGL